MRHGSCLAAVVSVVVQPPSLNPSFFVWLPLGGTLVDGWVPLGFAVVLGVSFDGAVMAG